MKMKGIWHGEPQQDSNSQKEKKHGSQNAEEGDDDELEDFFDEIDAQEPAGTAEDGDRDRTEEVGKQNLDPTLQSERKENAKISKEKGETDNNPSDVSVQVDDEEVSQAAYEARLAKLMLMSTRKRKKFGSVSNLRRKDDDDTNDAIEDDSTIAVRSGLSMEEITEGDQKKSGAGAASISYRDIMKKRQKKKRDPDQFGSDDDAFWSNF